MPACIKFLAIFIFTVFILFCSEKIPPRNPQEKPDLIITNDYGSIRRCSTIEEVYNDARMMVSMKPDIVTLDAAANSLVTYISSIGHLVRGSAFDKLLDAGIDPYSIVVDTLKNHGITVLSNIRMNDHHGRPSQWSPWDREHKDWSLAKDTGARDWKAIGALRHMDFAVKGVRDFRLSILNEILEKFNVDGFQLDFGRTAPFLSEPKREKAKYMTEFIRDVRKLLNETSQKKNGNKKTLGIALPWDLDFCGDEGLFVKDWVKEGLIDYVSPGEWYYADWNIPLDGWKKITEGSNCKLYPFTPGNVSMYQEFEYGEPSLLGENRLLDGPKIRSIADNFASQNPDGFAFYNFYTFDYGEFYPSLRQWTDPELNKNLSKHYYFGRKLMYHANERETFDVGVAFERIPFRKDGDTVTLPFRFSTDISGKSARMRIALKNMDKADEISVSLNGNQIKPGKITPDLYISSEQDSINFIVWEAPVSAAGMRKGENEIQIKLIKEHRGKNRYIEAGEFEIFIDSAGK